MNTEPDERGEPLAVAPTAELGLVPERPAPEYSDTWLLDRAEAAAAILRAAEAVLPGCFGPF